MKPILFTIFFFSLFFSGLAQDTLLFNDNKKLVVIVKEVSQTEIQYKKIELPDGPMYIVNKSDIQKIIYKNGYSETITVSSPPPASPSQDFKVYNSTNESGRTLISYRDTKRRSYSIINLIERHPDKNRQPELFKLQRSIRNLKAGQDATKTVSIVFGGITIVSGAFIGFINLIDSSVGGFEIPIVTGSVALVTCASAITFHINLKKKRQNFVKLYNE